MNNFRNLTFCYCDFYDIFFQLIEKNMIMLIKSLIKLILDNMYDFNNRMFIAEKNNTR